MKIIKHIKTLLLLLTFLLGAQPTHAKTEVIVPSYKTSGSPLRPITLKRDKADDVAIYSASAITPFVSGGGARLTKNILKDLPKILARENKQEIAQLIFKKLFKAKDDDIARLLAKEAYTNKLLNSPKLLTKIELLGNETATRALLKDILEDESKTLVELFADNPQLIDAWEIISHRSTVLRTNTDALEAISKIRSNPKFADFGLDDNLLGQLKGWGYGVDIGASFAEVITDLDRLLTNCGANSINITNFNKITDVLKAGNNANTKGMHWIIQDLADDVTTFNNKTITLEFTVPNARGTSSYLDVYCADCFTGGKRLLVEYKYGPTSITKQNIIKQFIERDLFNPDITSINQIQWRLKETGLTKTQLHNWLISDECRTAIGNLGKQKK